ncbi:FlgD immunoglobulin-like domain containing protein [Candidatus Neomarinimicrobiota bacterium]
MNSAGTVLWDTTYGGSHDSYGLSITELGNGEFAMAGAFRSLPDPQSNDAWVLKLSADGDSLGSVFYGDPTVGYEERFNTVRATGDGGLILLGEQTPFEQDKDIILVKTDGDGVSTWEQTFGGTNDDSGEDLIQTSDGGFAVIGYGDLTSQGLFDMILIHTDAAGTADWTKQISGPAGAAGTALTEISAGEYLAVAIVIPAADAPMDGWIIRLGAAPGETVTWDGGGEDNFWATAANWSGDAVPGAGDDVVIDLDGAYVSIPYGPITIASLTLGGGGGEATETLNTLYDYNQGGMRLTVTGTVTVDADGYLNLDGWGQGDRVRGDSLITGGGVFNNGTVQLKNGSTIKGDVTNSAILNIDNNGYTGWTNTIDGNFTNNVTGTINITGGGENGSEGYLEVRGDLSNTGWIKLFTQQYAPYPTWFTKAKLVVSAGDFTNIGTILDTSTTYTYTERSITATSFDNQGIVAAKAPSSIYSLAFTTESTVGTFVNSGSIHAIGSVSFSNVGTFTNSGTVTIDTNKTLTLSGFEGAGAYTGSGEQFYGNGTLSLSDVALDVTAFPPLDSLNLTMSGSSSLTLADSLIVHRSLSATGSSIAANGVRNQGSFSLQSGASLTSNVINNGTFVLNGGSVTGTMVNNDSLDVSSGTALSAGLTNTENATLVVTAGSPGLSVDGDLTNHGLMILKPQASSSYTLVSVTNGSLINTITGTILGITGITGTSTSLMQCNLVNEGLFDNHFKIAFRDSSHTNGGTIRINQAAVGTYQVHNSTLAFESGATFTNTGTVILDTAASLSIIGATYQGDEGTLEGVGTLSLSKSTGHLGQKFVAKEDGIRGSFTGSTIYVDSLINQTTWTAWGTTVYADSVIINQGKLVLEPYSSNGYYYNAWHGPFINEDTLIFEPYPQYTATHVSANEVLGGPMVNETGAVLLVQSSTHGSATLTVDSSLTNHGQLTLLNDPEATYDYQVKLNVNKGWLTNSGVVDALAYSVVKADLDNQGTFNVNPNIYLTMDKNPETILNSGAINVTGGDYFKVDNLNSLVITETGLLIIDAGCTAKFNGPYASGNFPSPDADFIVMEGGEVNLLGNIEGTYLSIYTGPMLHIDEGQKVIFTSSRVHTDSLVNNGHLTMSNASVKGEVVNGDTIIARLYGAAFDSTLVNEAGAIIRGEGNYSNGWTYMNVDSAFINHGELELTTISTTAKGVRVNVGAGNLVNSSTGSIDAVVGTSTNTALEHRISAELVNQGILEIDSAAVLAIVGTAFNNDTGGVVQGEGILDVTSVEFVSGGAINPGGSPGIFTIEGDMALGTTNVINLELEGDEPGTGYDQLHVTGNAALAGSLKVSIIDYIPDDGRTFQPLVFGSSSGVFESLIAQGDSRFLTARFTETGVYVTASITPGGNNWPFIGGIADITVPEDTTLAIVLEAFDPDEGDVLTFSASSDTPAVELVLTGDTLTITPELNWNGTANIEVIVTDLAGEKDTTDFTLTLSPVQDKPLAFDLVAPRADSTVTITAENQYSQSLELTWDEAIDPDGDAVGYDIHLTGDLEQLPARTVYGSDTYVSWMYYEITTAMSNAGSSQFTGTWTVAARDPADTTIATNGPFTLNIDASAVLGVDGQGLIPEVYALHPNYPNPFNPSTTIRYDLPEAADISLVIYDMLGREVVRLAPGRMEAGYHQMVWNGRTASGREVPSGIYIARMVTAEYTKSMKMVLLK